MKGSFNPQDPSVIILAAGKSERMGQDRNKNYLFLSGKPVLARSIYSFLQSNIFSRVVVVLGTDEEQSFRKWVLSPFFGDDKRIHYVEGGENRQGSVYNGLKALKKEGISDKAIVCIHDGARPLVDSSLIMNVYNEALVNGAAVPGLPLQDTIKEVDEENMVLNTPLREKFVSIQTPQCFEFSSIFEAHLKAEEDGFLGSDDSVLVERTGKKIKVVPGSHENIKLTIPFDITIAEAVLSSKDDFSLKEEGEEDQFFLDSCR